MRRISFSQGSSQRALAAVGRTRLGARLEKRGTPIGANDLLNNDLLMAAQALALGYVMVTDNEREFSRVEGLRLQNWLRTRE